MYSWPTSTLLLSTLHVLMEGFAVVLGTNNMSNAELVVQGIAECNLECY